MGRQQQIIDDENIISYLDEGLGKPLLFIHGFTGTATADHARLMDEFRPTHRLIGPDLRGYGASRPPSRDFPVDFYRRDAADMAALLDAINCGPVTVLKYRYYWPQRAPTSYMAWLPGAYVGSSRLKNYRPFNPGYL